MRVAIGFGAHPSRVSAPPGTSLETPGRLLELAVWFLAACPPATKPEEEGLRCLAEIDACGCLLDCCAYLVAKARGARSAPLRLPCSRGGARCVAPLGSALLPREFSAPPGTRLEAPCGPRELAFPLSQYEQMTLVKCAGPPSKNSRTRPPPEDRIYRRRVGVCSWYGGRLSPAPRAALPHTHPHSCQE